MTPLKCQFRTPLVIVSPTTGRFIGSGNTYCINGASALQVVVDNATGEELAFPACDNHSDTYDEPGERITEQDIDQRCDCDYDEQNDYLIRCSNPLCYDD